MIAIFQISALIEEFNQRNILLLLGITVLFYLCYKIRRIQFDDQNIYRIYGKTERVLPFSDIESIKRSGMKINGTRIWKVTYLGKEEKERKFYFKEGTFRHGSTNELIAAVKKINPSVVIWLNPFFNHPEAKKK